MSDKKAPNLAAAVEKDLTSDLKKVGGFFRGLWGFTQKAERAIEAAKEPVTDTPVPRQVRTSREIVVETSACDVCGGARVVGGARKIPCPACSK